MGIKPIRVVAFGGRGQTNAAHVVGERRCAIEGLQVGCMVSTMHRVKTTESISPGDACYDSAFHELRGKKLESS